MEENWVRVQVADVSLSLCHSLFLPLVRDNHVGPWLLRYEPLLASLLGFFLLCGRNFGAILENFDSAAISQLLPSSW